MTLTEQWKKGELPFGAYYVNRLEEHRIWLYNNRSKTPESQHEIYEILAPVPSYEEWQVLKEFADYSLHNRDELTRQINFCMDKYTQLEKENQQLKELLKECRTMIGKLGAKIGTLDVVEIMLKIDNAIGEKK